MKSRLIDFLKNKMKMTEIYQPVIIKRLLISNGECTKSDLALEIAMYDTSVLEYYKQILMRWPYKTLKKHNIISYERTSKLFKLNPEIVDLSNPKEVLEVCNKKIEDWLSNRANERTQQVRRSIRYEVLKQANGKCELCGISKSLIPLDIDHIVPRTKANKNGKVFKDGAWIDVNSINNLQALCFKCNRAKRDTDSTDFRRVKKLVRDNIPELIKNEGRRPKIVKYSGKKLCDVLHDKLIEEISEYLNNNELEELADIIEVIFEIANQKGLNKEEFLRLTDEKKEKNGGFSNGYVYLGDNQ